MQSNSTPWRSIAIGSTLLCALTYMMVFLPDDFFLYLAKEDGVLEWTGTIMFLIPAILFFLIFFRPNKFLKEKYRLHYNTFTKRIWFLLLGLLFVFLFGEEISWGQRIFGIETPEALEERNMQGEITLHNLDIFHLFDENDERKKGLALHLTAKRIFIYIFTLFMLFLPLAVKFIPFVRKLIQSLRVPVPVVELGFMFVANVILYLIFKPLAAHHNKIARALSEVQELNFGVILFFLPFVWFLWKRR